MRYDEAVRIVNATLPLIADGRERARIRAQLAVNPHEVFAIAERLAPLAKSTPRPGARTKAATPRQAPRPTSAPAPQGSPFRRPIVGFGAPIPPDPDPAPTDQEIAAAAAVADVFWKHSPRAARAARVAR